ncbi:MAG: alpha/beta fold hydrolase [Anaerolineae bacterium]|nr:alpha/beta fold hydrolase [Anaerolineae bacterium]
MRGHGKSEGRVRWASVANYVCDVASVADQLEAKHGKRPVVVGHSMGGFVVQHYLGKHSAPAGILLASIPPRGFLPGFLRYMRHHPIATLKTLVLLNPYYMVNTLELTQKLFFSPSPPFSRDRLKHYFSLIEPESFRMALDSQLLALPNPRKVTVPMLVLGAENDMIFTQYEVRQTAKAYRTTAEFFPNMAHDMMVELGWQTVADRILAWLSEQKL